MERPWFEFYDENVPTHIEYPRIPIHRMLDDTAKRLPDHPLTSFFGKRMSYKAIKQLSDNFAASVRDLGIKPGDRVALLLPNFPGYIIAYYGLMKAGAVVVPLNPLYTAHELEFHFTDSGAETVVTIPMFAPKAASLAGKTPLKRLIYSFIADFLPFPLNVLQKFKEKPDLKKALSSNEVESWDFKELMNRTAPPDFEPFEPNVDDLALMIYSGGTTGIAKGIMLSHFNVVANAHQIAAWGDLNEKERILAVLPLFHGYGMNVTMNAPILSGMEIVLLPKFSAKGMAKAIHKYKPTITAAVPTILVALSNLPNVDKIDLSSLKAVWVGAAPLTEAIKSNFEAKTGGRAIEGYGLTEAVTAIMANPYKGKHKVGSIGLPFPDVDAKIVSIDGGKDLPPGEQGEIVLKTPTMMLGYYNRPEETAKTIIDGWLYTGDIGYMDEDGYFYITDRKKDLIIVGGFNVFPREIDELLYKHPKVKEGITVGVPDEYKGEKIKVYIVLKEGVSATVEEFEKYFREHLTPYKVPSEIEFRSSLPKSAIGKILRRALREEEIEKMKKK